MVEGRRTGAGKVHAVPGRGVACLSSDLAIGEHGIWTGARRQALSYPLGGNLANYEVEDASFWFRHRNDCIVALVRRFPPDGPLLDVGGGNGYVARRLVDEGFETSVLEPGPDGALLARTRRLLPEVICSTLEGAAFPGGALPAVGLFDVVEHLEDDTGFLAEVHRLMRPGGMLYVTLPAHRWLWSAADVVAGHHRRYDGPAVRTLLQDQFEVLYLSYFFAPLVVPILLLRALPYRLTRRGRRPLLSLRSEHGAGGGAASSVARALLAAETRRIARGATVSVGASCLVAARRRR